MKGSKSLQFMRLLVGQLYSVSKLKYGLILDPNSKILDDVVISRPKNDEFVLVSNAARSGVILKHVSDNLDEFNKTTKDSEAKLKKIDDCCLLSLQGPLSSQVIKDVLKTSLDIKFMEGAIVNYEDTQLTVNRCGYTGEDGFELIIPHNISHELFNKFMNHEAVKLAGLGARDTLRLEAGLCLYGNDINELSTPIESKLMFAINQKRFSQRNFIGSEGLHKQICMDIELVRSGFITKGAIPRNGAKLFNDNGEIGYITSGIFSPTLKVPIAMGYIKKEFSVVDTEIEVEIRTKRYKCVVSKLPFVGHQYFK